MTLERTWEYRLMARSLEELKYEDVFDSRDLIERIEELEQFEDDEGVLDAEELRILREFAEEASGYAPDWSYGETLIRDSYFRDYAEQLAEDIGAISGDLSWPLTHIDWEGAARALRMDYTSVTLDGIEFWIR